MPCPPGYIEETFALPDGTVGHHCLLLPENRTPEQQATLDRLFGSDARAQQAQAEADAARERMRQAQGAYETAQQAPGPISTRATPIAGTPATSGPPANTANLRKYFILGVATILIIVAVGSFK
jgi:hypothetical protein